MRVEVHDHGRGFNPAEMPGPSTDRAGGWGLRLVAALAHRWGSDTTSENTTVWFEIDRQQRETRLPITPRPPTPLTRPLQACPGGVGVSAGPADRTLPRGAQRAQKTGAVSRAERFWRASETTPRRGGHTAGHR